MQEEKKMVLKMVYSKPAIRGKLYLILRNTRKHVISCHASHIHFFFGNPTPFSISSFVASM